MKQSPQSQRQVLSALSSQSQKQKKTEHILVCLSSSPSNEMVVRTAAKMADAFQGSLTALFVETRDYSVISEENKNRLQKNRILAQQLGARCETIYGDEVAFQIAEYARLSEVTQIVVGQSGVSGRFPFSKASISEQLLAHVSDIEIHIIPDKSSQNSYRPQRAMRFDVKSLLLNTFYSLGILLGATVISSFFYRHNFTAANIIMVYILGVLLTSIVTSHTIYSLVSSFASVIVFNYFFTEPRFTFFVYETGYPVTFLVMFLTAYITGTMAIRYKQQARQSATTAYRYKILLDTNQLISKAQDKNSIVETTASQITKLLHRNLVFFLYEKNTLSEPLIFPLSAKEDFVYREENDTAALQWVLTHNHLAGKSTEHYTDSQCLYFSVRVSDRIYGILGVEGVNLPLDSGENSILLSILGECAMALENEQNAREKEAAAILAESEQLRATLLRSISHDLRTPLTSISGHASNLLHHGDAFDQATRKQILTDIYDDSIWLIELVENLLYATRIEEGRMVLKTSSELLSDIVEEACSHVQPKAGNHRIILDENEEFIFVRVDAKLIIQVIVNLIDNALKYTQSNSTIHISYHCSKDIAEICVSDNGPGISDEEKVHIFEKFYSGSRKIADNRRSIGLGLFLCKSIVEAHGGTIEVRDHLPAGTEFHFTLPVEEVSHNE